MVDCHPEETLSTEAEPRSTICFSPLPTKLQFFTHRATSLLNVTRCYDVAKNATTAAIGFSVRTVRAYIRACYIFFFECHPPFYSPCKNSVTFKNVTRSIYQSDYRKLTRGIIILFHCYIVWLRITEEGSVPEMRIWSMSLI